MFSNPWQTPSSLRRIDAPLRTPVRSLGLTLLALGLGSCAPDHADNSAVDKAQAKSDRSEPPKLPTPLGKVTLAMLVDLKRIFDCRETSPQESCVPKGEYVGHISLSPVGNGSPVEQIRKGPVHHISTSFQIGHLDKKQVRRPMDPPELGFKLLHYLFPWWKGSDAWLNRAIAIGQRKTDIHYRCPSIAHWQGYYIAAYTGTAWFDSSANLHLVISRYRPAKDAPYIEYDDPRSCQTNPEIVEIGP